MLRVLEDTSRAIVEMELDPLESFCTVPAVGKLTPTADATQDAPAFGRLPRQLVERYVKSAVRRAMTEQMSDGRWYAEIALLPGVWAEGDTEAEALAELESVTDSWVLLKIEDHDRDFPVLETLDLNRL